MTRFTDSLHKETKITKRAVDAEGDGRFMIYGLGFEVRGSRGRAAASCSQVLARSALARWHSAGRDRLSAPNDAKRLDCVRLASALESRISFEY